jgi:hypothetical protein
MGDSPMTLIGESLRSNSGSRLIVKKPDFFIASAFSQRE